MSIFLKGLITIGAGAGVVVTSKKVIIEMNFINAILLAICAIIFSIGIIVINNEIKKRTKPYTDKIAKRFKKDARK